MEKKKKPRGFVHYPVRNKSKDAGRSPAGVSGVLAFFERAFQFFTGRPSIIGLEAIRPDGHRIRHELCKAFPVPVHVFCEPGILYIHLPQAAEGFR